MLIARKCYPGDQFIADVILNFSIVEVEVHYVHIGSGLTYFSRVTACNTADLCTSAVSDGVTIDNNPPNVGVVTDGTSSDDIEYQSIT